MKVLFKKLSFNHFRQNWVVIYLLFATYFNSCAELIQSFLPHSFKMWKNAKKKDKKTFHTM